MKSFEKRFVQLLESEIDDLLDQMDTDAESDAMDKTLDPDTDKKDFDTGSSGNEAARLAKQNQEYMTGKLKEWIEKIDGFIEYLNGTENSMQTTLHDAPADTLFNKIAISETKKIARVSMELSSLNEMLKGYLVGSNDPKLRYV